MIVTITLSQLCGQGLVLISISKALNLQWAANTAHLYGPWARPLPYTAITLSAVRLVPNYTAWWQRHNLPRVVTWQWNGHESNLWTHDR